MENVVLYRKYRPQAFGEVIGQDHITQTLKNAIANGTVAHAYLFSGPRGSGKTTMARILAKAINCQHAKDSEPCNQCDSCREITEGRSLDLVEIDAASHTGVDDVRDLISGVQFAPAKAKYKVFIIDECHQLSKSAFNALLKTLEEPPSHAVFILATTEMHKILPTIVSRCQRFDFKKMHTPLLIQKMEGILKKEKIKAEPAALQQIALAARGSFRDAESLLDKCVSFAAGTGSLKAADLKDILGVVEVGKAAQLVDFIAKRDSAGAVKYVDLVVQEGADLQEFARTMVFYLRQMLLGKINPQFLDQHDTGLSADEAGRVQAQAVSMDQAQIQQMLERFVEAEQGIKYASISQLPLELAVVDIIHKEA